MRIPKFIAYTPLAAFVAFIVAFISLGAANPLAAEDWPGFAHDDRRSNVTSESVDAARLVLQWQWRSDQPPQPAWHGPAVKDYYRNTGAFRSMREYDPVFYPVVVGDKVFFGSTGDDSVHCLSAATGQMVWTFTTDAPVRVAPTFADGRLYFGSDDGHAYCISASDGTLVWKFCPSPNVRRIFNNGRLISPYPCRTGVVVRDSTAYFAASMLPWRETYVCAVNAKTGKPEGKGRFVRVHDRLSLEGPLAVGKDRLLACQGRVGPVALSRADGSLAGGVGIAGGSFLSVTDDGNVLHGPGNRTGWVNEHPLEAGKKGARMNGVLRAIALGDSYYAVNDKQLARVKRKLTETPPRRPGRKPGLRRDVVWSVESATPFGLIAAGQTLFVGGHDRVAAFDTSGKQLRELPVVGNAFGLAVSGGRLIVSTSEGILYFFAAKDPPKGSGPTKQVAHRRPAEDAPPKPKPNSSPAAKPKNKKPPTKKPQPLKLAFGPYVEQLEAGSAAIHWQTEHASPSVVLYGPPATMALMTTDKKPKTTHELRLDHLRPGGMYVYQIQSTVNGETRATPWYGFDTFFNYHQNSPPAPERPKAFPDGPGVSAIVKSAEHILRTAPVDRGVCVVLGSGSGRLAWEIARRSRWRVIGVDTDEKAIAASRRAMHAAGVYGGRVTLHYVKRYSELPFVGNFASLVVSERVVTDGKLAECGTELNRLLRPGGIAIFGWPKGAAKKADGKALKAQVTAAGLKPKHVQDENGSWITAVRGPLPGAGDWTHQYGTAAAAAYGGESLRGARSIDQLSVQWVGRPGPRHQVDRFLRKPAPLVAGGRLFSQGHNRIVALCAYSGVVLWSLEVPDLIRFNVPRDSANWCCDEKRLYAAIGRHCMEIDAATGRVNRLHRVVPGPRKDFDWDFGYVGRAKNILLGSAVKAGTSHKNYYGRGAWHDGKFLPKVCSDNLFALDADSGKLVWKYARGVIINPTIIMANDRVYFTESRHAKVISHPSRRVGMNELWQDRFLVALDLANGKKIWEKPLPPRKLVDVSYLAASADKLVLVTNASKKYHVLGFQASDGKQLWHETFDGRGNHGAHVKNPAIVGGRLYIRGRVMDLTSGKMLAKMPGEGCGTCSLSEFAVFGRRRGVISMWNSKQDVTTGWHRLRPGCWLSTIPAAGMVLAPEAGGGCQCGKWLETSVAFMPRLDATGFVAAEEPFLDRLAVKLRRPLGGGPVYYTLDGSEPTSQSPRYQSPIMLTSTATIRARAASTVDPARLGDEIFCRFERLPVKLITTATINFQRGGKPPEGVLADVGRSLGLRKEGRAYGWSENLTKTLRKIKAKDPLTASFVPLRGGLVWEVCVENGTYDVTVSLTGPRDGKKPSVLVESNDICHGKKIDSKVPTKITRSIHVKDGRITIQCGTAEQKDLQTNLYWVELRKRS